MISVIYPGIDIGRIVASQPIEFTALNIEPSENRICFLGRLDRIKRVDLILRALAHIREYKPDCDFQFLIIGDGPERQNLQKLTSDLSLEREVHFLGFRSDYPEILKICRVYVLASEQEGWGIATAEALASGLIAVVSAVDGSKEQIIDRQNGFLVPPGNHLALAEAILSAIELADSPERKNLTEQQLQTLSSNREAEEYLLLYYKEYYQCKNSV